MVPEDAERLRERLRLSNDEHGFLETYGNLVGILKSLAAPLDALAIRRLVAQNGLADLSYALTALAGEPQPVLLEDAREALERFRDGSASRAGFSVAGLRSSGTRHPAGTPDRPGAGACAAGMARRRMSDR